MTVERAQMRGMQHTIQELTRAIMQATQGGGNRAGVGDLHRDFRSLNPPRFSGSTVPDEAEHWLKETERIFRVMQCAAGDKLLLATFQLQKDARAWWESVEATRENGQFTWNEFKEAFNSKYFSERVQERKAAEFATLKQRSLTVAKYEAQFSRLERYADHLVNTERMKAKHFLNGLKPQYITQLAPLDIQTYVKIAKKAQLLEDATDFTDCIKEKFMKKEMTSGQSSAKPNNGKKSPFNITEGSSQERKLKVFLTNTPAKNNCKHCDKPGHTADECWRKVGACLHCGSREHRIPECPLLKENERHKRPMSLVSAIKAHNMMRKGEDGSTYVAPALSDVLEVVTRIPVSSHKYELARGVVDRLLDENVRCGSPALVADNRATLAVAFSRTLRNLEVAVRRARGSGKADGSVERILGGMHSRLRLWAESADEEEG
ncbi:hypothetical protein Taro_000159 [Colocasia esculenta]|uniref:CCHC-type domain-containing protein n=1 Tax=Colocasia esculenta TaxID=4460 RepID=A0A843TA33_COLES|nr:hypothetical protein [Colocasia esculenta]